MHGELPRQPAEVVALGHEVALAVHLDERAHLRRVVLAGAVEVGLDHAVGRLAAHTLGRLGDSPLPQQDHSLLEVAVCLLEGPLAVHHAAAGHVTEFLDELQGDLRH